MPTIIDPAELLVICQQTYQLFVLPKQFFNGRLRHSFPSNPGVLLKLVKERHLLDRVQNDSPLLKQATAATAATALLSIGGLQRAPHLSFAKEVWKVVRILKRVSMLCKHLARQHDVFRS